MVFHSVVALVSARLAGRRHVQQAAHCPRAVHSVQGNVSLLAKAVILGMDVGVSRNTDVSAPQEH